ncbi:hypothetical protein [Lederbergia citri]|uniref:Uncharacterized protein n=1 Tax=Lederbergia citri TaxID=2833580 RepID=A0A942YFN1_9BACI|nr:hypothetical protein [Lederbergia citri]MBS4193490.1 hypothetical protein [Lederbergia citri]
MIEKNPALELVEVFMVDDSNEGGSYKYKGNIYQIEQYKAESLEKEGSGIVISVPEIDTLKQKINTLAGKLQDDIDKVRDNHRLSPEGKKEDAEEILKKHQLEADQIQETYTQKIADLKKKELEKLQQVPTDAKLSVDEARTQAGMFRSELSMIDNFDESVEFIKTRIDVLDKNVIRELFAQFIEIKKELEEKQERSSVYSDTANAYSRMVHKGEINKIYELLKDAMYGPGQAQSANKYKLLSALEQQRNDIRFDYSMKVTAIKRAYGIE